MRKIFFVLAVMVLGTGLTAQSEGDRQAIQEAADELAAVYDLSEEQRVEMLRIQERRFRNLAEIEPLREQDYRQYLAKRKSVRTGTANSIERMLRADQRIIFQQRRTEQRKRESEVIKRMRAEGATKEEIQLKLLEFAE